MAVVNVAVGNGAEMRISAGTSVSLTVAGPLIAVEAIVLGGSCLLRCLHSVAVYQQNDPAVMREWTEVELGRSQSVVEQGWTARFHNAVLIQLEGDPGTELTFWIPGEDPVTVTL